MMVMLLVVVMTEDNLHNSTRPPYLMYDVGSVLIPVPEEALAYWTDHIKALMEKHMKAPQVNIWKDVI